MSVCISSQISFSTGTVEGVVQGFPDLCVHHPVGGEELRNSDTLSAQEKLGKILEIWPDRQLEPQRISCLWAHTLGPCAHPTGSRRDSVLLHSITQLEVGWYLMEGPECLSEGWSWSGVSPALSPPPRPRPLQGTGLSPRCGFLALPHVGLSPPPEAVQRSAPLSLVAVACPPTAGSCCTGARERERGRASAASRDWRHVLHGAAAARQVPQAVPAPRPAQRWGCSLEAAPAGPRGQAGCGSPRARLPQGCALKGASSPRRTRARSRGAPPPPSPPARSQVGTCAQGRCVRQRLGRRGTQLRAGCRPG